MLWLIFGFTIIVSLLASWNVKRTYAKYSRMNTRSGYTGGQAAYKILRAAGIQDVDIVEHKSFLGDHYDPINKRLVLCSENYHGQSPAALGVAAHECGHAIQHKLAYAPLQWRMASVGATGYANQVVTWLPLLFIFTGGLDGMIPGGTETYLMFMAAAWGIIMLFNLVTLPVEFDASKRAAVILGKMNFITTTEESTAMKKVLNAAAWTYVAAFISSLLYMLYYLLPLLLGRNND
ncbi:MAG: zinc metallopeptidase [Verrucomicrobiota bacterium]